MPRLNKEKAHERDLLITEDELSDQEIADRFGQTFKAVWDRRRKLKETPSLLSNNVQGKKEERIEIIKKTKETTLSKRWKMIQLLEAPLEALRDRIKAWKGDGKDPLTKDDIKVMTNVSRTMERVLRGIDRVEGVADTLLQANIQVDQSTKELHIHKETLGDDIFRYLRSRGLLDDFKKFMEEEQ